MLILGFAVVMSVIAAIASALRGEKFIHVDEESIAQRAGLHHGHGLRIHHDRDGKASRTARQRGPGQWSEWSGRRGRRRAIAR